ncbi:MAG: helical backbone metal receptor [Sphingobacteriaceae bacterium]|nr:helical backbone metal receptor [Sphingobacteriaceae bacterium]
MQRQFTDQLNRNISVNFPPKRIISLVPSQTELLFDLGLTTEVVGITKFCIHPKEKFKTTTKIGGTKTLNIELIKSLAPDLIIGNKEENTKEEIEALMPLFPVWMSDIFTLKDAQSTISQIGDLVNKAPEANYLNHLISQGFNDIQTLGAQASFNKKTVLYLIWKKPYICAAKNTFIDDILSINGLENCVKDQRYPELKPEEIVAYQPHFIFLSSEPYPFKEKDIAELQTLLPNTKILLVDGEMFSWYGSRLVKAVQYFFEFQKEISFL